MGKFGPVFSAFLLNSFGVNIFITENKPECEPLISCLIFLFAVFILLYKTRLYPTSLRKLPKRGNWFFEFLLADFTMEYAVANFWFPLEASVTILLLKLAEFANKVLKQTTVFSFLAWDGTAVLFSYALSFYFLFHILHATRIVDFRLLKGGLGKFFEDIMRRLKKFQRRWSKYFVIKKVKFGNSRKSSMFKTSPDFDDCDENVDSEEEVSDECLESYYVPKRHYY